MNILSRMMVGVAVLTCSGVRADDFVNKPSGITVHTPDGWQVDTRKPPADSIKLSLQTGEPGQSDTYGVMKLGYIALQAEEPTIDEFKDQMAAEYPKDWKTLKVEKVTVGKNKLPGIHAPYSFVSHGLTFRVDLFLFKRGKQYTFFQFVGTDKAYDALRKQYEKIVADAEIGESGEQ